MRRSLAILALTAGLVSGLTGCASPSPEMDLSTPTATETSAPAAGASSIEDAWEAIGCKTDDPLGTKAVIQPSASSGLARTGTCAPDGKNLAFFFEADDPAAMDAYFASGALEVGPGDAVFRNGSVLMLATDAATAMTFASEFDQVAP